MEKIWLNEKNEFVSLTMEQIKSLSEEDKGFYIEAKEENLKSIFEDFKVKNEGLKSEIESLAEKNNEEITELKNQIRELAENKNKDKKMELVQKSVLEQIQDNKEAILKAIETKDQNFALEIKAPATQTTGYTISNGLQVYAPQFQGVTTATYRPNIVLDAVGKGSTSSKLVSWVEETAKEGSFAMTAEGGLKPLMSETYTEKETSAKKATGRKKMSMEQIQDLPQLTAIILNNIKRDHDKFLESQIYSGDGTGENLKGILEYAQSLTVAAPFATNVVDPNLLDVIIVANNQIEVASDGNYSADMVVLNPADFNKFKTLKDNTGNYVYPDLATNGTLDGKMVATSTLIAQDKFLLMDSSRAYLLNYMPFTIKFGWENDDFSKNLTTVIGESRNAFYITDEESIAFVYDTISTTITAITKP
jgi:HK97 family phage major capsid protein